MSVAELQAIPVVSDDGRMTKRYLNLKAFAERIGITTGALGSLNLPEPDVIVGDGPRAARGWSEATIDKWNESRPGRGGSWGPARTKNTKK